MKTPIFIKCIISTLSFFVMLFINQLTLAAVAPHSTRVTRPNVNPASRPQSYVAAVGTIYGTYKESSPFGWRYLGQYTTAEGLVIDYHPVNGPGPYYPPKCPDGYTTVFNYGVISTNRLGQGGSDQYYTVEVRADLCFGVSNNYLAVCGWNLYNRGRVGPDANMFRGVTVSYIVTCEYCKESSPCPLYVSPIPTNSAAGTPPTCSLDCTIPR